MNDRGQLVQPQGRRDVHHAELDVFHQLFEVPALVEFDESRHFEQLMKDIQLRMMDVAATLGLNKLATIVHPEDESLGATYSSFSAWEDFRSSVASWRRSEQQ